MAAHAARRPRVGGRGYGDRVSTAAFLLVLEGGEGAGKSTLAAGVVDWARSHGRAVTATREPGGTPLGERIRDLLLDRAGSPSPRAEALLYAADRAEHVAAVLRPALAAGELVVCDRFADSSVAYQGAGRTLDAAEVAGLSRWATGGLVPDLTVLLDLDPAVGLARAGRRGPADRLESESLEFHRRVREEFRALAAAEPGRYLVLDAAESPERLLAMVTGRLARTVAHPAAAAGPAVPVSPAVSASPGAPR